jgi:hypothetical protein
MTNLDKAYAHLNEELDNIGHLIENYPYKKDMDEADYRAIRKFENCLTLRKELSHIIKRIELLINLELEMPDIRKELEDDN